MRAYRFSAVFVFALAVFVSDAPLLGVAHAEAQEAALEDAFARLVQSAVLAGLPGTRVEPDGSITALGLIADLPGAMVRRPVAEIGQAGAAGGIFLRTWTGPSGQTVTTVGGYETKDGETRNVNVFVLEGVADVEQVVEEALRRDAIPLAVNSLPFLANYAHPTSVVLLIAFVLAVALIPVIFATAGVPLPSYLVSAGPYMMLAPIFGAYPYHVDPQYGEVFRPQADVYVWHTLARAADRAVWDGHYVSRDGAFSQRVETRADGMHDIAEGWKRDVIGPVVRVDADTTKLQGLYVRHDVYREFVAGQGQVRWEASQDVTVGPYDWTLGELPGASVRMEETKEDPQSIVYVAEQSDTISLGVRQGDSYTPLVGTRTYATHRPYQDVTNLGAVVSAIESYRVTSVGFFADGAYAPVFGADYWGERAPTDLWALSWALGGALGDQNAGDVMLRTGTFVQGRFVAVAGSRIDDDFAHHRYDFRTMVSTGLFQTDPLDPGAPVPGEAPDGAVFRPLVASTYDGVQPVTFWALSNVGNAYGGMGTFLLAAGLMGADRDVYLPLVGAEYVPESFQDQRPARETYRVGIFPGDYRIFIPVAGASYDGDQTSLAWPQSAAFGATGAGREGTWDVAVGPYVGSSLTPLVGLQYRPTGTASHAHGYTLTAGAHDLGGAFVPLVRVTVAFQGPPAGIGDTCQAQVVVSPVPTGVSHTVTPPCAP